MPKARRWTVVALAIVFWMVTLGTFVEALYVSPALNPQPTEPETLSSTIRFSLPPPKTPWEFPMSPVMITYTITGEAIVDNKPLTMDVLVKIPSSYMIVWRVSWVTVMPDNVVGIDVLQNGTILNSNSNFFPLNKLSNMTTSGETWGWHHQILVTSFGAFASTVEIVVLPTEQTRSINPSVPQAIDLVVHNATSILVESSRTVAAEKSAAWATQQEISLTWIIISLASLDVGFRVYDYSFYEKKNPTENASDEEP